MCLDACAIALAACTTPLDATFIASRPALTCTHALSAIGADDPIIIIKWEWLERILNGDKTVEIRCWSGTRYAGKRVWLAASRTSCVYGMASVSQSIGPLTESQWDSMRPSHCVQGTRLYGSRTHAWVLSNVQHVQPKRFRRKPGSVGSQLGPG
jgi:hypothetical protein